MNRMTELLITSFAGLIALPFYLAAACVLRLSLGAPSFFRQVRSGQHGREIMVVKLRTMSDARDAAGELLPDAERQTFISTLVRRVRLDEIPQLWLILKGDMALVGPRPLLPVTIAAFGPEGTRRGAVRPGLTGWAQVSGNTKLTDAEKLRLDLWYIDNRSTALDLRILCETIGVALFGERRRMDRLARVARRGDAHPAPPAP